MKNSLTLKLIQYIQAESKMLKEYQKHGTWHVDVCFCDDCKAIDEWHQLSFWQKLKAKLNL